MSGRKSNLQIFQTITNGSMAGNLTSAVTNTLLLDNIGYQVDISGTATGTITIQVSIDYDQDNQGNVLNAGHWINLTSASQAITSGSPTDTYFDILPTSAPWIRLVYTSTSGTGTMNAFITGKSV